MTFLLPTQTETRGGKREREEEYHERKWKDEEDMCKGSANSLGVTHTYTDNTWYIRWLLYL